MGISYLSKAIIKYHNEDLTRAYVTTAEGIKIAIPRYFKQKVYDWQTRDKVNEIIKEEQWKKNVDLDRNNEKIKAQKIIFNTNKMLINKRNKI